MAEFPKNATIGDKYKPAMEITDEKEAFDYFEKLVRHMMRYGNDGRGMNREEAERIEKINLGYFAGYYNGEVMERVNRLFCTRHPIFG